MERAESLFGGIDILVKNAGYCVLGALEDTPDAEIVAQMQTNFLDPVRITQAVLPGMRKGDQG